MTQGIREAVIGAVIGGFVTVLGSLGLVLATGAWTGKENAADHRNDVSAIHAEYVRLKDVICLDHLRAPQCQPVGQAP